MSTATANTAAAAAKAHIVSAEELQARNQPPTVHDFTKDNEQLSWKINTAPQTSETLGKDLLAYYGDTFITDPPMQKVIIKIGVGIELKVSKVSKGVKVKDVIEAIYTKYGKKFKSEEPEFPYLIGFTWDEDDGWATLTAHLRKEPVSGGMSKGGSKKAAKKAKKAEGAE